MSPHLPTVFFVRFSSPPLWGHLDSFSVGTEFSYPAVRLTTYLHLVQGFRMRGYIPPLPQYVFLAWCLVKHRDNFAFTFPFISCVLQDVM